MSPAQVARFALPFCVVFCVVLAASALAQGPPSAATPAGDPERIVPSAVTRAPATAVMPVKRVPPLAAEMRAVLEGERVQCRNLFARFRAATDPAAALAIQREIEQLRVGTEIALLRIQAGHARKSGRAAQAAELERLVTELQMLHDSAAPASRSGPEPASR